MVVLVLIVTIKNEKPVELVLKSTCKSSCFLVTKIFNNLVFYLLQSKIVHISTHLNTFQHILTMIQLLGGTVFQHRTAGGIIDILSIISNLLSTSLGYELYLAYLPENVLNCRNKNLVDALRAFFFSSY